MSNDGFKISKSLTGNEVSVPIPPFATPVTVGIERRLISSPSTVTPVILLNVGTVSPGTV